MTRTVLSPRCPEASILSRFVQGLLDESAAVELAGHLDRCVRCQQHVDGLARDRDSLLDPVRQAAPPSPEDPTELGWLIERAQQAGPQAPPPQTAEPISLDAFVACLRKSGLLEPGEIESLVAAIRPADSEGLARGLVARKKLTPFQAKALLRGRWKRLILGNYVILDVVGQGGMSAVFKARHRLLGRIVCLKVPRSAGSRSPDLVERFRREAMIVAALEHPNIVVAHDADEADGVPFLVMELVEGRDLAQVVAARGPLPVDEATSLLLQAARALDYAHRQGVVHRDVKPHNLLLDESGAIKILDMGLARFDAFFSENPDATTHVAMTATGVIMGTVDYVAPEQALNSRLADPRSDVYSLGCTLHFLLTGRVLYAGNTLMEKLIAHREHAIPSLRAARPDVSGGLDAVFRRMVAKAPDDRYPSMAELADDLEAVRAGREPATARSARAVPGRWTRWRLVGVAGLVGVAVIGLCLWLTRAEWLPRSAEQPQAPASNAGRSPLVGHPQRRINGGPGRVLIVLPYTWFYDQHYTAVQQALKSRGIASVMASSQPGKARSKNGTISVAVELTLDQFDANDFDAVVFLGGNLDEFLSKSPKNAEHVRRVVEECLGRGRTVGAIDDAQWILGEPGLTRDADFLWRDGYSIGRYRGRPGVVITARNDRADELVRLIFPEDVAK